MGPPRISSVVFILLCLILNDVYVLSQSEKTSEWTDFVHENPIFSKLMQRYYKEATKVDEPNDETSPTENAKVDSDSSASTVHETITSSSSFLTDGGNPNNNQQPVNMTPAIYSQVIKQQESPAELTSPSLFVQSNSVPPVSGSVRPLSPKLLQQIQNDKISQEKPNSQLTPPNNNPFHQANLQLQKNRDFLNNLKVGANKHFLQSNQNPSYLSKSITRTSSDTTPPIEAETHKTNLNNISPVKTNTPEVAISKTLQTNVTPVIGKYNTINNFQIQHSNLNTVANLNSADTKSINQNVVTKSNIGVASNTPNIQQYQNINLFNKQNAPEAQSLTTKTSTSISQHSPTQLTTDFLPEIKAESKIADEITFSKSVNTISQNSNMVSIVPNNMAGLNVQSNNNPLSRTTVNLPTQTSNIFQLQNSNMGGSSYYQPKSLQQSITIQNNAQSLNTQQSAGLTTLNTIPSSSPNTFTSSITSQNNAITSGLGFAEPKTMQKQNQINLRLPSSPFHSPTKQTLQSNSIASPTDGINQSQLLQQTSKILYYSPTVQSQGSVIQNLENTIPLLQQKITTSVPEPPPIPILNEPTLLSNQNNIPPLNPSSENSKQISKVSPSLVQQISLKVGSPPPQISSTTNDVSLKEPSFAPVKSSVKIGPQTNLNTNIKPLQTEEVPLPKPSSTISDSGSINPILPEQPSQLRPSFIPTILDPGRALSKPVPCFGKQISPNSIYTPRSIPNELLGIQAPSKSLISPINNEYLYQSQMVEALMSQQVPSNSLPTDPSIVVGFDPPIPLASLLSSLYTPNILIDSIPQGTPSSCSTSSPLSNQYINTPSLPITNVIDRSLPFNDVLLQISDNCYRNSYINDFTIQPLDVSDVPLSVPLPLNFAPYSIPDSEVFPMPTSEIVPRQVEFNMNYIPQMTLPNNVNICDSLPMPEDCYLEDALQFITSLESSIKQDQILKGNDGLLTSQPNIPIIPVAEFPFPILSPPQPPPPLPPIIIEISSRSKLKHWLPLLLISLLADD